MFVLDDLYVSAHVLDFLEASQHPVMDNADARRWRDAGRALNIVDGASATEPDSQTGRAQRIITLSEMHLDDVKPFCSPATVRGIEICKDKAALRRAIKPLYPEYVFETYAIDQLDAVDPEAIAYPAVLKPATGFFSLGIYPLFNADDWAVALDDIRAHSDAWQDSFNSTVVNNSDFLLESYITGREYALDAYFDETGRAVVLDILEHDFAGADDVSDRLYFTSKQVIETQLAPMTRFLDNCNALLGLTDFPVHVEVRVTDDGQIIPIEFNPLRFAGLSTTDISYLAWGFKTYEYFVENKRPDWDALLADKAGVRYTMMLLGKEGFDVSRPYAFDYDALVRPFRCVKELRKIDFAHLGTFGFLFTETRDADWDAEVEPLLRSNLDEYIIRP